MTLSDLYLRQSEQLTAQQGDECIVMNPSANLYYGLNRTATFVWNSLNVPRSLEEIVTSYRDHFNVSNEIACRDVLKVAQTLLERHMIVLKGVTTGYEKASS